MPPILLNPTELLPLIRSKVRQGAEVLYDQYAAVLSLAIFRIVKEKKLTDELLKKTICKIWDTADQYNERETSLLTWMLAIAKGFANEYRGEIAEQISV
jgi:DNA-directed RNA polymerase specialized sigma24 family protein